MGCSLKIRKQVASRDCECLKRYWGRSNHPNQGFKSKMNFNHIKHHVKCGLHSGFPLCCIMFWLCCYYPCKPINSIQIINKIKQANGTIKYIQTGKYKPIGHISFKNWIMHNFRHFYYENNPGWGYVPCPLCMIRNNQKKVQKCSCYKS